jgi:hypothetical protein
MVPVLVVDPNLSAIYSPCHPFRVADGKLALTIP